MIGPAFESRGFEVYQDLVLAELVQGCIESGKWVPYRDIESIEHTTEIEPIFNSIVEHLKQYLQAEIQVTRREIWRGCISGAAEYHSDQEDEDNDCVAVICVETGTYPISFYDQSNDQAIDIYPKFGDVILINHHHPTVLHKGPVTNGPTNEFLIGQISFKWI